jgi:UPF0042 nucleotide-binding protein
VLEDLRYFCIDNLPVGLLASFASQMVSQPGVFYKNAAVGIDARNRIEDLKRFPSILSGLREGGLKCEVVFMEATDEILIKRFSETRRKHPLTNDGTALSEAITQERKLLEAISTQADLYLDTSHTNLHQLRDLIRNRVAHKDQQTISIQFQSFGFKHGIPVDADLVFDVRCLPNPYWETQLREFTGLDQPVIDFLDAAPLVKEMFDDLKSYLANWIPRFKEADRTYLTIAIGCTGGQHRSVYLVNKLAKYFAKSGDVIARHRELE